ncbi:VRR-NUC domain-containing protein [Methylovorus sp. MP688]|uniref:VRR-NUC domain-containing protein n=1 Tax=Methylovorus sp. (strain MP688) TaxID=887061 RepID=UPI0001EC4502|nr:VRR-NUC domain-containing protein [Methylovorus sp. MP688]ADQ83997.1 conserved hypothetical protein [Methylovorus sp. MP688]
MGALVIAMIEMAIEAGVIGWRAYEAYQAAQAMVDAAELAKAVAQYKAFLKEAVLDNLKHEIDVKSSQLARVDSGGNTHAWRTQSEVRDQATFRPFINRRIPFRLPISHVVKLANEHPIKVPRRLRTMVSASGELRHRTIEVALRQYTASVCFETVDAILDWKSPLKAELAYNPDTKAPYLNAAPPTRPKRVGNLPFTFWPVPRGALIPDLTIAENRHQPAALTPRDNVFAVVEIKFPNDPIRKKQLEDYSKLVEEHRVALMRVPEDLHVSLRPKTRDGRDATRGRDNHQKRGRGK